MVKPLPSTDAAPTYLEFFGMSRPPFARLSAPAEIYYSDQCSLLNSYLAGASEQPDSLVVVCGVEGGGRTTLLNQYIAGLDEDACYATFDESCLDGTQFYCSFLTQIGFGEISGSLRELRRITREFLLHRGKDGDPILFFVDNAQLIRPSVLEQIRWICETKIGSDRVLSLVLAGNLNLPRIMDSPAMSSIKFRNQTNFHIRVCTESETDDYVRHRLQLAGAIESAKFSDDSRALIYRFTGGVPGLINKLCNEVLAEAFAQNTRVITEQIIRKVADTHQIMPHVVPLKGKGRRGSDTDKSVDLLDENAGERISGREPEKSAANIDAMQAILKSDAEVKELQGQLAKLQEQLQTVEEEKNQSSQQIVERDLQIEDLRMQLAETSKKSVELAETISSRSSELAELKAGLSEARALLQEGSEASEHSAAEIKALEDQLSTERKESQKLHAELEQNDAIVCRLTEDLARSEAALTTAEQMNRDQIAELESLNKEIVASEKNAQKLVETAEKRRAELEQRAATLSQDLENLQLEHAELGEIADSKDAENDQLRAAISANEKSLAKSQAKVDRLSADLDKWDSSKSDEVISDLREQLAAQAKELDDVLTAESTKEEEAEALKRALETLEKKLTKKEKSAKSVNSDLKKERRKSKRASAELSDALEKYGELERRNDELQDMIETLNADFGAADNKAKEADALRQSLETLREEYSSLQEQVDAMESLQDTISERERRIAELEAQVAAQEKAASTASQGIEKAKNKPKSISRKIKKGSTAIQSIEIYRQGKMLQAIDTRKGPARLMVGRATDSDLRLNSKFVSRHHALLFCTPERTYVEDLNSSNGIIVNGKKVDKTVLTSEDKIVIGDFHIVLREG